MILANANMFAGLGLLAQIALVLGIVGAVVLLAVIGDYRKRRRRRAQLVHLAD